MCLYICIQRYNFTVHEHVWICRHKSSRKVSQADRTHYSDEWWPLPLACCHWQHNVYSEANQVFVSYLITREGLRNLWCPSVTPWDGHWGFKEKHFVCAWLLSQCCGFWWGRNEAPRLILYELKVDSTDPRRLKTPVHVHIPTADSHMETVRLKRIQTEEILKIFLCF